MTGPARARLQRRAVILSVLWLGGCATYTDTLSKSHKAADRGNYESGIRVLNDILGVARPEQIPNEWTAHRALAALERAVLFQAQGQYAWSARDLSGAEMELEFMDLKLDTVGTIGKYVYNDSAKVYKALPTERLAINALNMLNYLAMDNLEGASVEARRFTIARQYLESLTEDSLGSNHGAFGSYVAGFVFEKLGEPERALRYYEEALDAGKLEALREPVLHLYRQGHYVGEKLKKYIRELENSGSKMKNNRPARPGPDGEILIMLALGRVPYKIPRRMAVGAAVGYAGLWVTGNPDILTKSAFKVVAYPELVVPKNQVTGAAVSLNGQEFPVGLLTDLTAEITREYETIKPKIIGAALTRMIARTVAAEGSRHWAHKKEKGATATLAALATEAALVGLDKPDTRSWTFLPAYVYVCRARVTPGQHQIRVELLGGVRETRMIQVEVPPGGYSVVVITEPR